MIELRFEVTTTKVDFSKMVLDLENAALGCANDLMKMESDIVANWTNKPTFYVSGDTTAIGITYTVIPVGKTLQWRAVSRGAKGKTFGPKTAKNLVFPYQGKGNSYIPKTSPNLYYGGPGVKVGPIRKFKQVNWPGIEARHFEESVMTKYKPTFESKMKAALARAQLR